MPIEYEGLDTRRMSSKIGNVRLGHKAMSAKGKEHPEALPYFRFDPKDSDLLPLLHKIYGVKPEKLRIMFLSSEFEEIFPQYFLKFGTSGLLCKGTGGKNADGTPKPALLRVERVGDGPEDWESLEGFPCDPDTCPDFNAKPHPRCKRIASLMYMLPDFPSLGYWQTDTGGVETSVPKLNTKLRDLMALARATGRPSGIAGIPLIMSLNPTRVKPPGHKRKKTVYTLDLELDQLSLMSGGPTIALFDALGVGRLEPDYKSAPDGIYARSIVERGADPVQERIEMAAAQAESTPDLPDDIIEGVRIINMTKGQVRGLVSRYTRGDEFDKDGCLMYLSTLVDLVDDGTDISSTLRSLGEEETAEQAPEPEVVDAEEEAAEEEEEQEETPAKQTKQSKVEESTDVLGLDI